jgi:hypothetical protein
LDTNEFTVYEAVWGEMHIEYDVFKTAMDITPFLKGSPNDRDPCPHWGIVVKGQMTIVYDGKKESLKQETPTIFPQDTRAWQKQAQKFGNSASTISYRKP